MQQFFLESSEICLFLLTEVSVPSLTVCHRAIGVACHEAGAEEVEAARAEAAEATTAASTNGSAPSGADLPFSVAAGAAADQAEDHEEDGAAGIVAPLPATEAAVSRKDEPGTVQMRVLVMVVVNSNRRRPTDRGGIKRILKFEKKKRFTKTFCHGNEKLNSPIRS